MTALLTNGKVPDGQWIWLNSSGHLTDKVLGCHDDTLSLSDHRCLKHTCTCTPTNEMHQRHASPTSYCPHPGRCAQNDTWALGPRFDADLSTLREKIIGQTLNLCKGSSPLTITELMCRPLGEMQMEYPQNIPKFVQTEYIEFYIFSLHATTNLPKPIGSSYMHFGHTQPPHEIEPAYPVSVWFSKTLVEIGSPAFGWTMSRFGDLLGNSSHVGFSVVGRTNNGKPGD